ncbi:MAG: hypothetical protein QT02_C0011G0010 [archaeon GW2011_AR9]|nr:MAG: hypothetical protein QT02_C0011G0010 [archaeon GW2011_AR9]MBS3120889.1 hypothetical protein [Candidatus Woesearchaeota archaeon]HIG93055.1 hypothetical protein [Candidatus Woesearchaeota archaeon]HIH12583.1 hypothetical protein [Candidatus Woesearchaeota archaeon]
MAIVYYLQAPSKEELQDMINQHLRQSFTLKPTGFVKETNGYICMMYEPNGTHIPEAVAQRLTKEEIKRYDLNTAKELLRNYNGTPGKRDVVASQMGLTVSELDALLKTSE